MDEPSHRLRTALNDVVSNLTAVYANLAPHAHHTISSLVVAIANLVHVQESINDSIRFALRAEHRRHTQVEARVTALEAVLPNATTRHISAFHDSQQSQSDVVFNNDGNPLSPVPDQILSQENDGSDNGVEALDIISTHHAASKFDAKAIAIPVESNIQNASKTSVPPTNSTPCIRPTSVTKRPRSGPLSPENALSDMRPMKRKAVPPPPKLPTAREVEADVARISHARRAAARKLSPPCAKCRVRKRADMMRDFGRIKEDVYERWLVKPGGCLGFMHMDDPGAPRSPITFEETATESPRAGPTR